MISNYFSAILLTIPIVLMILPSIKYWTTFRKEKQKKNKGVKANYDIFFSMLVIGELGMWFFWLSGIIALFINKRDFLFSRSYYSCGISCSGTQIIGYIFFGIGAYLHNRSIHVAGKYLRPAQSGTLRTHKLVKEGPFGIIRHPLYTSYLMISIGLGLILLNYLPFLCALLIAVGIYPTAKAEEAVLAKQLGEDYQNYQKEVGMFFPKLKNN